MTRLVPANVCRIACLTAQLWCAEGCFWGVFFFLIFAVADITKSTTDKNLFLLKITLKSLIIASLKSHMQDKNVLFFEEK